MRPFYPMLHLLIVLASIGAACVPIAAAGQALPWWTATPVLRIGSDADAATTFHRLTRVLPTRDGRVVTFDAGDLVVRIFDARGRPLRTVGGEGSGPGEFSSFAGTGLLGDTIYVSDMRARRVTLFALDGTLISTAASVLDPKIEGLYPMPPAVLLHGGRVMSIPASGPLASGASPVLLGTRSGEVLDTIALLSSPEPIVLEREGRSFFGVSPFISNPSLHVSAEHGHALLMDAAPRYGLGPGEFRLTRVSLHGDTAWSRTFRTPPVPLTRAAADSAIAQLAAGVASLGISERELRDAIEVPAHVPPATAALVASDGRVWVRAAPRGGPDVTWHVFTADGEPLARVRLPERFRPSTVQGDTLWGVEQDETDVTTAVAYRVAPAPAR